MQLFHRLFPLSASDAGLAGEQLEFRLVGNDDVGQPAEAGGFRGQGRDIDDRADPLAPRFGERLFH
ncbi:hypothetical protein D9M69_721070 [compost metagenome]